MSAGKRSGHCKWKEGVAVGFAVNGGGSASGGGSDGFKSDVPVDIKGNDDQGNYIDSHEALLAVQDLNAPRWYAANAEWWASGGYGGLTDDEAMIGDELGAKDAEEGMRFIKDIMFEHSWFKPRNAVDAGAGVGRITKLVLLRFCDNVQLIEMDSGWLKRSKVYLGKKRASKCTFTCARLEEMEPLPEGIVDLVWIQWALQYLTDRHAIKALKALAAGLKAKGVMIVKENRPFGGQRCDRFHMETPEGEQGRYDITRSQAHHEVLFALAGLQELQGATRKKVGERATLSSFLPGGIAGGG